MTCVSGRQRVATLLRLSSSRLSDPVAVERRGASAASGAQPPPHRLRFTPLTIRQGTPLHERVAFERSSLRQFYEQVRECSQRVVERVTIRSSCSLRSATRTPFITPLQHAAGMCSFGSDACSTAERFT